MRISKRWWIVALTGTCMWAGHPDREALGAFPTVVLNVEPAIALGPEETASIVGVTELDTTSCTFEQGAHISCPVDMTLDINGLPAGVTACFVIDGPSGAGECVPAPTPAAPIGAEFSLQLTGLLNVTPGANTISVAAHPIDIDLTDGFHPTGQSKTVALTVFPVTLFVDSGVLPLELRAGSIRVLPAQVVRDPGLGPVTACGSASGIGLGASFNLDAETGEGTMTLSARSFV